MTKTFESKAANRFISTAAEEPSSEALKYIAPLEIKTAEPFKSLFAIKQELYAAIVASMKEAGYDEMQPVIIWKEQQILIDGHTRREAAWKAGIEQIPYIEKSFPSEEAALDYMYHLQFSRRNITDAELVPLAMRALESYEKKYGEGSKAEFLVKRFAGLSLGKAKRLAAVLESADVESIIVGDKTINSVYESIHEVKKDKAAPKQKVSTNFLNETDPVSETESEEIEVSPQKEKPLFTPELSLNEGKIYYTEAADKAKTILLSVAPSHNEDTALMAALLETVKKHLGVE